MTHYPPEFLEELLGRIDLVELVARHVDLKRSGRNLMGLCPFHHERTPSFSVSPEKQLFYCFGCGKGGGPFQFVMEMEGLSFPEAVERLAEQVGLPLPERDGGKGTDQRRAILACLVRAERAYHEALFSPMGGAARGYLKKRGLPETIWRKYQLGYAPPEGGFLSRRMRMRQDVMERAGLIFMGRHGPVDRFRNRIMFPIRNARGEVVGFGGRNLGREGPKYLNSPEGPVFHKSELLYGLAEHREEIRKRGLLLVVEGYMDVLMLAAYDFPVALAPLGTAIGEKQIRSILRLHSTPVFCFDGDAAGWRASWRALELLLPFLRAEHDPRFMYLPRGEDPDSLLRKEGKEAFHRRIKRAVPVLDAWLAGMKRISGEGAAGRARMAKKADAMIQRLQDEYLAQAWRQEVEKLTGLTLKSNITSRPSNKKEGEALDPEERFLAAILQKPQRIQKLPEEALAFRLDNEQLHALYTRALQLARTGKDVHRSVQDAFPDMHRLSRWVNEPEISDDEFEFRLIDVWLRQIARRLKLGQVGLAERLELDRKRRELEARKRSLYKKINDEKNKTSTM